MGNPFNTSASEVKGQKSGMNSSLSSARGSRIHTHRQTVSTFQFKSGFRRHYDQNPYFVALATPKNVPFSSSTQFIILENRRTYNESEPSKTQGFQRAINKRNWWENPPPKHPQRRKNVLKATNLLTNYENGLNNPTCELVRRPDVLTKGNS